MNIDFLFIFILLLGYFNCTIIDENYEVQDITSPKVYQKYTDFPFVEYCTYSFDIYASCINGYTNVFPRVFFPESEIKPILQNDTSGIFNAFYRVPMNSINYIVSINVSGCDPTANEQIRALTIQLDCLELNSNDIVPNYLSKSVYYNSFIGYDHSYIKIDNLKYPMEFGVDNLISLGGGYYLIQNSDENYNNEAMYYKTNTITNTTFELPVLPDPALFTFEYYYKDSNLSQVSEFKYYPIDLNDTKSFIQKSKIDFPISTFKLKSDVSRPLQFYTSYERIKEPFYPLYGESDGTIIYYSPIKSSSYDQTINIFFKNGDYATSHYNLDYLFSEYRILNIPPFKISNTLLSSNVVNYKYNSSSNKINQDPFFTRVGGDKFNYDYYFPFGFSSGTLLNFYFEANFFTLPGMFTSLSFNDYIASPQVSNVVDNEEPLVKDIQIQYIGDRYVTIRVEASDVSGVSKISFGDVNNFNIITHFGIETLASGTIYDGIFEVVTEITYNFDIVEIMVYDFYNNRKVIERVARFDDDNGIFRLLERDTIYSINPIKKLKSWFNDNRICLLSNLTSITFDYYEMDVNNKSSYNTVYFNFSNGFIEGLSFSFIVNYNPISIYDGGLMAKWDSIKKLYYVKFAVTKNSMPGPLEFSITTFPDFKNYSSGFFYGKYNQVNINSNTPDLSGPIIKSISKIPSGIPEPIDITSDPINAQIGWNLVIEDNINGFSHGYVVVMGLVDGSFYNFTLNSEITSIILSNISCIDQTFKIIDIVLFDSGGKYSVLKTTPYVSSDLSILFNPLMYYTSQNISSINVICTPMNPDLYSPVMVTFEPDRKLVDVGGSSRDIICNIEVEDKESGINLGQTPTIYFTSLFFEKHECKTKLVSCELNRCKYFCSTELPLGFAYPYSFWYQIYGIINKNGMFAGYSAGQISNDGFDVAFSTFLPVVTKTSKITNEGGDLYIIGRSLNHTSSVYIRFNGSASDLVLIPKVISYNYLIININISNIGPFTLKTLTGDYYYSNNYYVEPIYVAEFKDSTENSSSVSDSSSQNNSNCGDDKPLCGGADKGTCTNEGCLCSYPWTGVFCQYKVIIVPQPSFNNSDPNIEIKVPNQNNSAEIEYTSLTSIVALRELDINRKPVNTFKFYEWFNFKINSTLNEYYTNFTNINNSGKTTQVKVSVQWFPTQTNIQFADFDLLMNPSSIKYTIEIKDYPFISKLNELQVVMSASFKSNNKDTCSSKEFNDKDGFNTDYLTIRVEDNSLYARFIKRGVIDSNITTTISNSILDDSFNPVEKPNNLQSFIGMSIPHFESIALIDPDFSIITNYQSSSTSICNKNLSGAKIAGIVIGCVAFVSIIVIAVVYHTIKKKKKAQFLSNVNQKMEQINNDKL